MAKIVGPLMSVDARGKFGSAIVFLGWKGIKTARMWLKPANPKLPDQGDIRVVIGGTGRAVGKVSIAGAFNTALQELEVIPAQQTKQSYLVKYIKEHFIEGKGATMTGNYGDVLACIKAHSKYTSWNNGAEEAGIVDFDLVYSSIAPFEKALGLYLLAKTGIQLGFTVSPYTKTLALWTATQIDKLVAHL